MKVVQGCMEDMSCFGMLVIDIRIKLHCSENGSISHIPREANVLAHTLGKNALGITDCIVYIEETPHCIKSLL